MWFSILFLVISVVSCPTADPTLRETESPSTDVSSENETEMSLTVIVLYVTAAVSKGSQFGSLASKWCLAEATNKRRLYQMGT